MKTVEQLTEEILDILESYHIGYNLSSLIEEKIRSFSSDLISNCADQAIDDATERRILNLIDKL
jgi:hypothetical protein